MGHELEPVSSVDPRVARSPSSITETLALGPNSANIYYFGDRFMFRPVATDPQPGSKPKMREKGWFSQGATKACAAFATLNAAYHVLEREFNPEEVSFFENLFAEGKNSGMGFSAVIKAAKEYSNNGFEFLPVTELSALPIGWSSDLSAKRQLEQNTEIVKEIIDLHGAFVFSVFADRFYAADVDKFHAIALVDYREAPGGIEGLIVDSNNGKAWMLMGNIFQIFSGMRHISLLKRIQEGIENRKNFLSEENNYEIRRIKARTTETISCFVVFST